MRLPETIGRFLDEYHRGGVTEDDCRACSSSCCSLGGFAILENVVAIFERYARGELRRSDFEFAPGLSFGEFVFQYFDVYRKTVKGGNGETTLMLFHMKSLSADGNLISVPGGDDYWDIRKELFDSVIASMPPILRALTKIYVAQLSSGKRKDAGPAPD